MYYKYIEQLLERYWAAETSPDEEAVLRAFFAQRELPEAFAAYRPLFQTMQEEAQTHLDARFDERVLARIGMKDEQHHGRRPFMVRLRPLMHAAAVIGVAVTIGSVVNHIAQGTPEKPLWDYNAAAYQDTYTSPEEAFEVIDNVLQDIRHTYREATADAAQTDSVAADSSHNATPATSK